MPVYKGAFEDENFRGVICHMKQTLESIDKMFDYSDKIGKKLYYLPLAYESGIDKIKTTDPQKIVLTFTNSFGGQKNNFPCYLQGFAIYFGCAAAKNVQFRSLFTRI